MQLPSGGPHVEFTVEQTWAFDSRPCAIGSHLLIGPGDYGFTDVGTMTAPWCMFTTPAPLYPQQYVDVTCWYGYCNDGAWACPALCAGQPGAPDRWDGPQWLVLIVDVFMR